MENLKRDALIYLPPPTCPLTAFPRWLARGSIKDRRCAYTLSARLIRCRRVRIFFDLERLDVNKRVSNTSRKARGSSRNP